MLPLVVAVFAGCLLFAPSAGALPYVAQEGKVMVGVTGGRTTTGYEQAAGKRPAMFQFFVAWDDRFHYAYRRADDADAALMLHLSTNNGPGTQERTTPRAIALGREDAYLYALGRDFDRYGRPVYLRLFSEMNNAANPYSVYQQSGAARDEAHSHYWFRQAWRRVFLIVNGGRVAPIERHLRRLGLPGPEAPPSPRATTPAPARRCPMGADDGGIAGHPAQPPVGVLAGRTLRRLGRHRLLLALPELHRARPLLRRQHVRWQAVRVRRVGYVG